MGTVDFYNVGTNQSEMVMGTTPDDMELVKLPAYSPRLVEILVVAAVLAIWAVAVFVFLKRWASIRIFQPMEPRYRHNPKNLDSVRIVKRTQDSVIYKNHNKKLSVTIVEREKKRLQRMHTIAALPTMEMEEFIAENQGRIEQLDAGSK